MRVSSANSMMSLILREMTINIKYYCYYRHGAILVYYYIYPHSRVVWGRAHGVTQAVVVSDGYTVRCLSVVRKSSCGYRDVYLVAGLYTSPPTHTYIHPQTSANTHMTAEVLSFSHINNFKN